MKSFITRKPRTAVMIAIVAIMFVCLVAFVASNPQLLGGLHFGGACVWQNGVRYCR
jgi:hypothetical protein